MCYPSPISWNRCRAFTLVELLSVIAIIGILAAILIPAVSQARASVRQTQCASNMRQIALATLMARQDNHGKYPAMRVFSWETAGYSYLGAALRPYLTLSQSPTGQYDQLFRCPVLEARGKNGGSSDFLVDDNNQYPHYRYNTLTAPGAVNPVSPAKAVLFFETVWPNWKASDWAHSPGSSAYMNVSYADGHVDKMSYSTYETMSGGGETSTNAFFATGWTN